MSKIKDIDEKIDEYYLTLPSVNSNIFEHLASASMWLYICSILIFALVEIFIRLPNMHIILDETWGFTNTLFVSKWSILCISLIITDIVFVCYIKKKSTNNIKLIFLQLFTIVVLAILIILFDIFHKNSGLIGEIMIILFELPILIAIFIRTVIIEMMFSEIYRKE